MECEALMVKYFCDCCNKTIDIYSEEHYTFTNNTLILPNGFFNRDIEEKMLCKSCYEKTFGREK